MNTIAVFCPATMTLDEPRECVQYAGAACNHCPFDAADEIAKQLRDIADILNYPAELFGTGGIAGAVGDLAAALETRAAE